ncbi:MAG: ABC transporter substrate-binding protein, partial [Alphaproteobacteria bacterium]
MLMNKMTPRVRLMLGGAALSVMMLSGAPAFAETPADTLVEAFAIDDVITLDPAEAFELTMGEINGNTYDKLVRLDI